ncbi:MAG: SRPBCC family protein [Actinomycetota bacterium]
MSTRTLELDRSYDVSPERLFAAWTDVAVLTTWWGCAEDMLWTVHAWHAVAGGEIHVSLDFDGTPFVVRGEFLVVDEPTHLRYRFGDTEIVDVRIDAEGAGSHLYLTHSELPGDEQHSIVQGGWTHALSLLGVRAAVATT